VVLHNPNTINSDGVAIMRMERLPFIDERPDPEIARDALARSKSELPQAWDKVRVVVISGDVGRKARPFARAVCNVRTMPLFFGENFTRRPTLSKQMNYR
jgi:hypothetical protein